MALGQSLGNLDTRALERFRLQHTGFVFQGFNLFPALSALQQVELPLSYLGLTTKEAQQRARQALEQVGLGPRMGLRPAELSGGEKQRVAIARPTNLPAPWTLPAARSSSTSSTRLPVSAVPRCCASVTIRVWSAMSIVCSASRTVAS